MSGLEGHPETGALSLSVLVRGAPQCKGSKTELENGGMIESGTNRSRQRKRNSARSIAQNIRVALIQNGFRMRDFPLAQAIRVDLYFYFPIARTRMTGKRALVPGMYHTQKPDRDKCIRHVGDAIKTSGIVLDDCYDACGWAEKRWCAPGQERTEIRISWVRPMLDITP